MSWLDDFQQWSGENRARRLEPIKAMENKLLLQQQEDLLALKQKQANEALQKVIDLERQKQLAKQMSSQPAPEETATVMPEWGNPQSLELFQAYKQAGIDPVERAKAQTARLASEAFAQAIPNITDDTGRINIGLGKEYRPDVYRHDEIKADDAKIRLDTITGLLNREGIDPLLAADVAQNKSVFDAQKVEIQDKNGKLRSGFATLTPSGNYVASTIKDQQGQPLNIPAEGSDKVSPEMLKARELKQFGVVKDIKEGLELVHFSKDKSPAKFWSDLVIKKSSNRFGSSVKPFNMLKDSLNVFKYAKFGTPLPVDITKDNDFKKLTKSQKKEIMDLVSEIDSNVVQPPIVSIEDKNGSDTANFLFSNISKFTPLQQQQPQQQKPFYQMPGVDVAGASTAEPAQQPELKPLTSVAIHSAWEEIQQGANPKEVQKALQQEGFDLSPQSVDMMAIEAINRGVPADVLQKYLIAIGIEWQPS